MRTRAKETKIKLQADLDRHREEFGILEANLKKEKGWEEVVKNGVKEDEPNVERKEHGKDGEKSP